MVKTVNVTTEVTPDHKVHITVPEDVPVGPAEVVLIVLPTSSDVQHTLGDLRRSEFFGMWKDREDITDSVEFARRLREQGWRRPA